MASRGNLIVGQSGGPSSVINSSLYGVIEEAKKYPEINKIIGTIHGIEGVFKEDFIDLNAQKQDIIEGLKRTPGAALRSCRYMLRSTDPDNDEVKKIFDVFDRYNIRYFLYIGGNDSMDTADKINKIARKIGYELKVIGVPKTIDNDLVGTHHCPGFGSCAKYLAALVKESGLHTESMYTSEPVTILSTVGRNTGWLPGATAIAKNEPDDAPHLIYFPEIAFDEDKFIEDVKEVYDRVGGAYIVVGQALVNKNGKYMNVNKKAAGRDSFGHPELVGAEIYLKDLVENRLGILARAINPSISQQSAIHYASTTDIEEAEMAGRAAVRAAIEGNTGYMITFEVESEKEYKCSTGLIELEKVANAERKVPREWITGDGNFVTKEFIEYVKPLVKGEAQISIKNSLPAFVKLEKIRLR
jgi:6-phosphofructokinase 1